MPSQIRQFWSPVLFPSLYVSPLGEDLRPSSPQNTSIPLVMSGRSIQVPSQSRNTSALQSCPVLGPVATIQQESPSHNTFSMVKPPPWASKSFSPLGPNASASVSVGCFARSSYGLPLWSGHVPWSTALSWMPFIKTMESTTKARWPVSAFFASPWPWPSFGTGSPGTSSRGWAYSIGYAGLLPIMLFSIHCLEHTPGWEWASSPSTGQWFPPLLIHWQHLYVICIPFCPAIVCSHVHMESFSVVVPNEHGSCVSSYVLGHWANPLLYGICRCALFHFWPQSTVKNVWNMGYLPISSHNSFDNTGSPYIVRNIVTNGVFDPVKYTEYSPVFLPTTLVLTYAAAFAAFPALFIHIFCKFLFFPMMFLTCIMNSSVVPKGHCPQISQHSEGWMRCSFSSHAILPRSAHVVVWNNRYNFLHLIMRGHQNHSHSIPYLGRCCWCPLIIRTCHPSFYACSHHKSVLTYAGNVWAHWGVHASRTPLCQYHLQGNHNRHRCANHHLFWRPEAWPLHEDTSSHHV